MRAWFSGWGWLGLWGEESIDSVRFSLRGWGAGSGGCVNVKSEELRDVWWDLLADDPEEDDCDGLGFCFGVFSVIL